MNRGEVQALLKQVASTWPGTPFTDAAVDLWFAACGTLTGPQAAKALAHWAATNSHPPRPADLNGAHRALYPDEFAPHRVDIAPPALAIGPKHEAPDIAHAELARSRAILRGDR